MGVGQSRELVGKISDDRVFICTNYNELSGLLMRLSGQQRKDEDESKDANLSTRQEDSVDNMNSLDGQKEVPYSKILQSTVLPVTDVVTEAVPPAACVTEDSNGQITEIDIPNHYMGDEALHLDVLNALSADQHIRSLNLAYNAFTASGISAIVNALLRPLSLPHPRLRSLNLAGNHAGPEGCREVAKLLAANPPIRDLSLFHNGLYDQDVQPILNALVTNTKLRVLNFDLNYLTGKFLRMLLKLLQHNETIAAVLFDGPYDPKTLEPIISEPRATGEDPTAEASAANARASLRRRLLRTDLAGRPPFPKDLVEEVEAILAPRRAAYLAALAAGEVESESDKTCGEEKSPRSGGDPCVFSQDMASADQNVDILYETVEANDEDVSVKAARRQDADGNEGEQWDRDNDDDDDDDDDDNDNDNEYDDKYEEEDDGMGYNALRARGSSRPAADGVFLPLLSVHSGRNCSRVSTLQGALSGMQSSNARESFQHVQTASPNSFSIQAAAAAKWQAKRTNKRKELSNGFDRLRLTNVGSAVPGCRTSCESTGELPRRLRACWCDPRDVAAPYGSILHYHCKHEPTSGDMGDVGIDGRSLVCGKTRRQKEKLQRDKTLQHTLPPGAGERRKAQYTGCKETCHKCESIGFYGKPKTDKSSVYFFSSEHPMCAPSLVMDNRN